MKDPVDQETELDDFDPYTGSDSCTDDGAGADVAALTRRPAAPAAWQRLEAHNDERWLREQMFDWNDYDDESRTH